MPSGAYSYLDLARCSGDGDIVSSSGSSTSDTIQRGVKSSTETHSDESVTYHTDASDTYCIGGAHDLTRSDIVFVLTENPALTVHMVQVPVRIS